MRAELAVKGLAVVTAIPVIGLALWADYFGRAMDEQAKQDPLYDRAAELSKVRFAGICAMFSQFAIFTLTTPIRAEAPALGWGLLIGAAILQSVIQARAEKKAGRPTHPGYDSEGSKASAAGLTTALRGFAWALVGGIFYLIGFGLPVVIATFTTRALGLSASLGGAVIMASALVGMLAGLAINFALAPLFVRNMLPTREIQPRADATLHAMLESCFAKAGLRAPSFWIVEPAGRGLRAREATAMIAGFSAGRGIFRPALFLSRGMLDSLTAPQLRAVVLHEVAHLTRRHLRKRLVFSAAMIFGVTALSTIVVFAAHLLLPQGELNNWLGFSVAAGAFVLTFRMLGKQSRAHESEADFTSVSELGGTVEDLAGALRKLDQVNDAADPMRSNPLKAVSGRTHPATDRRIAELEARFERGFERVLRDEQEKQRDDRAA